MTALHAALVAALDRAATRAEDDLNFRGAGMLPWNRVAADRRVLARHYPTRWTPPDCAWCEHAPWPCPDVRDLAARYDVEVSS